MKVLCLLSLLSFVTSFRPFFVNRFLGKNTQLNTIPIREPFSNSDSLRRYPLSRQHYQRYLKKYNHVTRPVLVIKWLLKFYSSFFQLQ